MKAHLRSCPPTPKLRETSLRRTSVLAVACVELHIEQTKTRAKLNYSSERRLAVSAARAIESKVTRLAARFAVDRRIPAIASPQRATCSRIVAGEMAEWLKAHAWKACLLERVTWVRIPLSPPVFQFTASELSSYLPLLVPKQGDVSAAASIGRILPK